MRLLVRDWRKRLQTARQDAARALDQAVLHGTLDDVDRRLADCQSLGRLEFLAACLAEDCERYHDCTT